MTRALFTRPTTHLALALACALGAVALWGSVTHANSTTATDWIYDQPGTYTWVAPADLTTVYVTLVGGGGGGANGQGPSQDGGCDCSTGFRGHAGDVVQGQAVAVVPGQSYTVIVGKGGNGGPRTYTAYCPWVITGASGGASTFRGVVAAGGGAGGGAVGTDPGWGPFSYAGAANGTGHGTGGTGMSCNNGATAGGSGWVKISRTPPPALTITANGENPARVYPGQAVTVTATFTAGAGDTLLRTAIRNAANNLWCGTGNSCSSGIETRVPLSPKTYTFSTKAEGTFVYRPAVQSQDYRLWSTYGASLTIVSACPANSTLSGGTCVCKKNYEKQDDGTCAPVAVCPNGAVNPPSCSECDSTQVLKKGQCVPGVCAAPHEVGYPTCACDVGYYRPIATGKCTLEPPHVIGALSANPTRVVTGRETTLTWVTGGMESCELTGPTGLLSSGLSSSGLKVQVFAPSTFVLTCHGGGQSFTSSAEVATLPSFQEI